MGRAISLRLSREGARVVLADLDPEAAERVASEIADAGEGEANETLVRRVDVTREDDVRSLVEGVAAEWGGWT